MSPETLSHMAQAPKSPEKSQAELRDTWQKRFLALKPTIKAEAELYRQALEDGTFDDTPDEPIGSGERRKETHQVKITTLLDKAEKLKKTLDSGKDLPQALPSLSTTYTHPDGHPETITLDLEAKLQDFLTFYQQVGLNLPPNFEDIMRNLWETNQNDIGQALEQEGFDDILLIPGNIPLPLLKDKLSMESGYLGSSNFKEGGSFAKAISQNADKPRLVLVHKTQNLKDRPELASTLNIHGQDVKLDQALSLEDYLIFQRKYFAETGRHLDEDGATWLATTAGARLVDADWVPSNHQLSVRASDLASQDSILGARPARCFF